MERVAGVDPSLASTGIAIITRTLAVPPIPSRIFLTTDTVKVPPPTGFPHPALAEAARVAEIVDLVCTSVAGCELVWVESLAYASKLGKYAERAHLYFSLLSALHARRHDVTTLAPTELKKRVTGSGRADKNAVVQAVESVWSYHGWKPGAVVGRSDRADASALAWLAALSLDWDTPPLVTDRVRHPA